MTHRAIFDDLSRQLTEETQAYLDRRMNQAAAVLEPAELVLLMHRLGMNVLLGAQTLALSLGRDDVDPNGLLDQMNANVADHLREHRASVLRTGEAIRRGEKVTRAL